MILITRPFFVFLPKWGKKSLFMMRQGRGSEATEVVFCLLAKSLSYRGAYRVPLFNQSASVSLPFCRCVCLTFVVFTDCESRTMPIFTNLGSMEACEYGLTRGTCFVARCLEVVVVAGLLWISWCVWRAADFFVLFFRFFFLRTHTASSSMRPPCLNVITY